MATICFTTILVDDMAKALNFYVDLLGFRVIKRDHYPQFVLLQQDTHPVALHQTETRADAANQVILGIATDDLEVTLADLGARGAALIHTRPQKFFSGHYAALRDPAGNTLELIQWQSDAWARYSAPTAPEA